jgi:hypothetical protein
MLRLSGLLVLLAFLGLAAWGDEHPPGDLIRLRHKVVVQGTVTSFDHNQVWIRLADGQMVELPAMDLFWEKAARPTQVDCVPGKVIVMVLPKRLVLR